MSGFCLAATAMMLFSSLCLTTTVDGYRQGAPSAACRSKIPAHGTGAQTSPAPYTLTVTSSSPTGYGSLQQIDVTLNAVGNATFKGFLIVAKATTGSSAGQEVGSWTNVHRRNGLKRECNEKAVTHAFNRVRQTITATWRSPARPVGPVVFTATVVEELTRFWLNVESEPLQPAS